MTAPEFPIKLKPRHYSMATLYDILNEMDTNYIRYLTQEQLDTLTVKGPFDKENPFVVVKIYKTHADKQAQNAMHMVFANHGQVIYCDEEVLDDYKLNHPKFFWGFQHPTLSPENKQFNYAENFIFSDDKDALEDWEAHLNYEEIFDHFGLGGGSDLAGFAGFFHLKRDLAS